MTISNRRTVIVHGRLAMREARLDAARRNRQGLQVMSFEQLAARLVGGFARPIDDESLRNAIQAVLPTTALGELESIKMLPGMIDASAETLHKAWRAGVDFATRAEEHPRLNSIAPGGGGPRILAGRHDASDRPGGSSASASEPH